MNHQIPPELVVDGRTVGLSIGRQGITPGRPNLIFVHGSGGTNLVWTGLLSRFSRRCNALAVELPGHGRTPAPMLPDIHSAGVWLYRVIDALNLDSPPILIGASLGGAIVLETAIHYLSSISGLILISTAARLSVDEDLLTSLNRDYANGLATFGDRLFSRHALPLIVQRSREALMQIPPQVFLHDLGMSIGFDRRRLLSKINVPVLVLCGDHDEITPPVMARELAQGIPNATLTIIQHAGHMVVSEQPIAVSDAIEDFLNRVKPQC